jgi:serine/threonine protein kinase
MGVVYFGVTQDGEPVAVKTIRAEALSKPAARSRFEREILALRMVQGPRVAALVRAWEPDNGDVNVPPWLAVEYIRGLSLSEYTEGRPPLTVEMGAALGLLLAEALTEIHTAGLLHRDFKPGNIILGRDGPIVIDFGLVGLLDETGDITHTGDKLGTPQSMAPKQVRAQGHVTAAADVYALGVVLVYATAGHYLYPRRPNRDSVLFAIMDRGTAPDLSGVPDVMLDLLQAMVAYDPASRPSLVEVAQALPGILAVGGLTSVEAQRQLARLTYVERPTDPSFTPPAARRVRRIPRDPNPPKEIVQQVADGLRRDYARDASL